MKRIKTKIPIDRREHVSIETNIQQFEKTHKKILDEDYYRHHSFVHSMCRMVL